MKYCTNCGKENPDENVFCTNCAAPFNKEQEGPILSSDGNSKLCKKCGRKNALNARFCEFCSERFEDIPLAGPMQSEAENAAFSRDYPGENTGIPYRGFSEIRLFFAIVCGLFGWLGIHRFFVGKKGTGAAYLLTLGYLGIGVIVDLIMIALGIFKDIDGNYIE